MSQTVSKYVKLLLTLALAGVLGLGWLVFSKWRLDTASRETAIAVTRSVLASGDAGFLIESAHPDLLAQMDGTSLQGYISSVMEYLGALEAINAVSGAADLNPAVLFQGTAAANYALQLDFATAAATALVSLRRSHGKWLITDYRIESPLLYN